MYDLTFTEFQELVLTLLPGAVCHKVFKERFRAQKGDIALVYNKDTWTVRDESCGYGSSHNTLERALGYAAESILQENPTPDTRSEWQEVHDRVLAVGGSSTQGGRQMNEQLTFSEFQELVKLLVPDAICRDYKSHYVAEGQDIRIQYDDSFAIYPWFCESRYHLHSHNSFSIEDTVRSVVVAVLNGDAAFEDYGDGGYETTYDRWYELAHWIEIDQRMQDLGGS